MSSADIDLENLFNEGTDDASALTPAPAPMPMPSRELRTVGGLMISAMSGLSALAPSALAPSALPASSLAQRAVMPAVENKSTPR
ncbi:MULTISPECIES: hypothetical protein [Thalassobaculum]|uniref:Uncharacterized protein n=1 Tax=Thalassobaculum litoreum DSM 18839 TaxID=1123362 RepID=A0A8G2BL41_9PROT|nr:MULTISPECIES: hypothetical protein [Thalassobaculum]SDG34161.1 hypothetical protein SAMN05660686_04077 [Thalassobaculum litoreum DSM 18839]